MSIINSNFQREGEGGEGRDQRPPPRDRGGQGAVGAGGKRRELGNSFFKKNIFIRRYFLRKIVSRSSPA